MNSNLNVSYDTDSFLERSNPLRTYSRDERGSNMIQNSPSSSSNQRITCMFSLVKRTKNVKRLHKLIAGLYAQCYDIHST